MLKIAICDDNMGIANYIGGLIAQNFNFEHALSMHDNTFSLLTYVEDTMKGNIDILVIDIDLGAENGIEIAERLKIIYPHIKVIFVSGFVDYAQDIFDVEPVYFILKPISKERVIAAISKAQDIIEEENKQIISVINKSGIVNVKINDIKYVESNKRIIVIHESNIVRETQMKLDEMEQKLPDHFLRCHQSYLVNMDRIKSFKMEGILLRSGEQVPVSRPKYNESKRLFLEYLGEHT